MDKVNEVDEHRSYLLETLLQLAINSGIVPKCLHVRGVNNVAQFPIASGGFGDVWRGEWEDRTVALKTVRAAILVSQNDDTIHRVRLVLTYTDAYTHGCVEIMQGGSALAPVTAQASARVHWDLQ